MCRSLRVLVCMYAYMYVCMYASLYARMYVCTHVCMHACTYVCMHERMLMYACMYMYVCMHVCTFTHAYALRLIRRHWDDAIEIASKRKDRALFELIFEKCGSPEIRARVQSMM